MNPSAAGALTSFAALAALGVAYYAQHVMFLVPCELCLYERWPYRITLAFGILAVLAGRFGGRQILGLAALAMLGDVLIAGTHVGVEFGFWKSPLPECNGELVPGAPLPMFPAVPCDRPVYLIHHLPVSMAMMDFCFALVFTLTLGAYVLRKPRRFS